jgi:RNA binding exosome subunit
MNQTIKSLIACLRSGGRILEDCTAEIPLAELWEILDATVERIDGTNLLRIRGDRQRVTLRGL